jgi:hypothetical protein
LRRNAAAINTKEHANRNVPFLSARLSTPGALVGQLAGLAARRRGLRYVRENLVLPLDTGHPIQQAVEFFGRKSRAEARDSARYFATGSRDRF